MEAGNIFKETLIKAFPASQLVGFGILRCKAAYTQIELCSIANQCASAGNSEEAMI